MFKVVAGVTIAFVLASPAHSQDLSRWYEVKDGKWHVPTTVVQEAARKIQGAANATRRTREQQAPSLQNYYVQFQGISTRHGPRVKLSGACETGSSSPTELSEAFRRVLDGGDCYFDAVYDPATKMFNHFIFNGVA